MPDNKGERATEKSIANGGTIQLELSTAPADTVITQIDDGTTGSNAAQYTLTQEVYSPELNDWMIYDEVTGQTALSWIDDAIGERWRITIENTSGGSANYRVRLAIMGE